MKLFKNVSIKWQLLLICVLLVSVPVITLGVLAYNTSKTGTFNQIEQELKQFVKALRDETLTIIQLNKDKVASDLAIADSIVLNNGRIELDAASSTEMTIINQNTQASSNLKLSAMKLNGEPLLNNYAKIDKVKELTGGATTIFQLIPQGMLRISTNVQKDDGSRAVGTYIPTDSPVYQSIIKGEAYTGRAMVLNKWYEAAYEPIKDTKGQVVGALFVGVSEDTYQEVMKNTFAKMIIGKDGYVAIVNPKAEMLLSHDRLKDGADMSAFKEVGTGRLLFKEWGDRMPKLAKDETIIDYYDWQNEGELSARKKVIGIIYLPEYEWGIAATAYQEEFLDGLNSIRNSILIISIIAILLGSLIAYLFASSITNPLLKLEEVSKIAAEGNLDVKVDSKLLNKGGEIGSLSRSYFSMIENVRDLITTLKKSITSTANSAQQLSTSSEEVNAAIQQISSTIQQIAAGAQRVTKGASESKDATVKTKDSAEKGSESARLVNQKMGVINKTTKDGAEKIKQLGEKSKAINNIVETINNISQQTNLLALNASIEAARAGEAGRGFAVVADEVRKLAEESEKATQQISELTTGIQAEINSSVENMNKSTNEVEDGVDSVEKALESFNAIPKLVETINSRIIEMTSIAEQNASGSGEVSSAVQQVSASMQQVSSTAQMLYSEAENLKKMIAGFRIGDESYNQSSGLDSIIRNFIAWSGKVKNTIKGKGGLTEDEVKDYQASPLGNWYYSEGMSVYKNDPSFKKIETLGKKVYKFAKDIVEHCAKNEKDEAKMKLADFETYSQELISSLQNLRA